MAEAMWMPAKERVIGLAELEISKPQGTRAIVWTLVCQMAHLQVFI